MDPNLLPMYRAQRSMLAELLAGVQAGADVDELLCGHDLLHLFGRAARSVEVATLPRLDGEERSVVAAAVLAEMVELLDEVFAQPADTSDGTALAHELEGLFRELSPCIPEALTLYQRRAGALDAWLDRHPEVLTALLEATMSSRMTPYDLLEALMRWMAGLERAERDELHRRFATEPAGVITESLARAEFAAELDGLTEGLEGLG